MNNEKSPREAGLFRLFVISLSRYHDIAKLARPTRSFQLFIIHFSLFIDFRFKAKY